MNQLPDSTNIPILTFSVGKDLYALPIDDILEVAAMLELTPVPDAPPEFLGVADRHGVIVPVVDLRCIFLHEVAPITPVTLFIVARRANNYLGLVVDDVHQVEYIPPAQLQEVSITSKNIRGIINHKSHLIQMVSLTTLWATLQPDKMAEDQR